MRCQNLLCSLLLLLSAIPCYSQNSQYMYYFDKDLNTVDKSKAVFYGTGEREDTLVKLMLYNSRDKHLILIERFTDSSLLVSNGLSASFYFNQVKESEGITIRAGRMGFGCDGIHLAKLLTLPLTIQAE